MKKLGDENNGALKQKMDLLEKKVEENKHEISRKNNEIENLQNELVLSRQDQITLMEKKQSDFSSKEKQLIDKGAFLPKVHKKDVIWS